MSDKKENGSKNATQKLILATALIKLIAAIIDIIDKLIE